MVSLLDQHPCSLRLLSSALGDLEISVVFPRWPDALNPCRIPYGLLNMHSQYAINDYGQLIESYVIIQNTFEPWFGEKKRLQSLPSNHTVLELAGILKLMMVQGPPFVTKLRNMHTGLWEHRAPLPLRRMEQRMREELPQGSDAVSWHH